MVTRRLSPKNRDDSTDDQSGPFNPNADISKGKVTDRRGENRGPRSFGSSLSTRRTMNEAPDIANAKRQTRRDRIAAVENRYKRSS